jgi:hypothetical protein
MKMVDTELEVIDVHPEIDILEEQRYLQRH